LGCIEALLKLNLLLPTTRRRQLLEKEEDHPVAVPSEDGENEMSEQ
jgi:hypothetical protein